jgi:hypothetical protein
VDLFDQYEIRARMAPTAAVFSPLFFAFFCVVLGVTGSWPASLGALAAVALVLTYVLSSVPRQLGKRIEPGLWETWGGPPTTRRMRWRDGTLDDGTKRRLRERAEGVSGVNLSSEEEEERDPDEADERVSRAFEQVRAAVRKEDPEGVWAKHNAEYGLYRNLLGSRVLWIATSVSGALICAAVWYVAARDSWLIIGFGTNLASAALAYVLGWHVLPSSTKMAAERYAQSITGSFVTETGSEGA